MIRRTAIAALGILGVATAQPPFKKQDARELEREVDALVSRYAAFGFQGTVLVTTGDVVVARGYGMADATSGRRNDAQTLFEIASITKQFTAAAILLLEQRGKLSTDDSIAQHLPGVPEHSRGITIYHLLTHTSGVPGANTKGSGTDLEHAVTTFLGEGPKRQVGAKWEYWNGGYALLAGIIERASGESYVDFCRKNLFEPAGMENTGFTGSTRLPREKAAIGTSQRGAPRSALDHPYGAYGYQYRGMGGVVTTALDLVRWHWALQNDSVLGAAARKKLFAAAARARGQSYACGWFVGKTERGTPRHQHGGSVRGFMSDFRRFPDENACAAVLSNGDSWVIPYIAENLECLAFGKKPRHTPPPAVEKLAADELATYVGTYSDGADSLEVTIQGSGLRIAPKGKRVLAALKHRGTAPAEFHALPTGEGRFVHWTWRGAHEFGFVRDDGKVGAVQVGAVVLRRR